MRRGIAWLHAELPHLVEKGVLTPETADSLRRYYGPPPRAVLGLGWGQVLLASAGAVLVGGGIILILAHNWSELGRPLRAAIAVGLLVIAQALVLYAVVRRSGSRAWCEATSALLVTAVGASIAIVGQTYHVGGTFQGLIRAWLWLVVWIPYLTGSMLASIGFWMLLAVGVVSGPWRSFSADVWVLVAAAAPFVILQVIRTPRSWAASLVASAAAASVFIVGSMSASDGGWDGMWAVFQVCYLSAIIALTRHGSERIADDEPWRKRLFAPAWLALVVLATILSFREAWHPIDLTGRDPGSGRFVMLLTLTAGCALYASVMTVRLGLDGRLPAAATVSAAVLVVIGHLFAMNGVMAVGWLAFNVWLLAAGVVTLIDGGRRVDLGTANRGLLAVAAVVLARFFDTDLSFLARGLAFVALGLGCFAVNVMLVRRARQRTA